MFSFLTFCLLVLIIVLYLLKVVVRDIVEFIEFLIDEIRKKPKNYHAFAKKSRLSFGTEQTAFCNQA